MLFRSTVNALKAKDMQDMLAKGGTEGVGNTPKDALDFLKMEIARWGKVIRDAKVQQQQIRGLGLILGLSRVLRILCFCDLRSIAPAEDETNY